MIDKMEEITGVNSLYYATESDLVFWDGKNINAVLASKARNILTKEYPDLSIESKNYIIVVENIYFTTHYQKNYIIII